MQGTGSTENFGLHEFEFLLRCLVCHLYGMGVGEKARMMGGIHRWLLLVWSKWKGQRGEARKWIWVSLVPESCFEVSE